MRRLLQRIDLQHGSGTGPIRRSAMADRPVTYSIFVGYVTLTSMILLMRRGRLTPERIALAAVAAASARLRAPALCWKWLPAALSPLMFADLRGFAEAAEHSPHVTGPIRADRWLLRGRLVNPALQSLLARSPGAGAIRVALMAVYLAFWATPAPTAIWLSRRHPQRFSQFIDAFLMLQTSSFAVYLGYPEAPPWMAAEQGLTPPIERTIVSWLDRRHEGWGRRYAEADPAPLRAMPALHCAVPTLVAAAIIAARDGRGWVWLCALYPACVVLAVLCLGEHYLIDVLVGVVLAVGAFIATERIHSGRDGVSGLLNPPGTATDEAA